MVFHGLYPGWSPRSFQLELEWLRLIQGRRRGFQCFGDAQPKFGLLKDVPIEIYARRDFDYFDAVSAETHHASFRHIKNVLTLSYSTGPRESYLLYGVYKLFDFPFFRDA